eukprot:snap_masked-scaffold_3-processed-gene-18.21-mRNA-1 protein AED:1.00 eAED:1.00 QI:0/0/0/0/1/1/3/0/120
MASDIVEKVDLLRWKKVIFADRLVEGVKPRKTYEIFEKIFPKRYLKVELFARCANLKTGWIQIGLEADPRVSDLVFGCYRPEKSLAEKTTDVVNRFTILSCLFSLRVVLENGQCGQCFKV